MNIVYNCNLAPYNSYRIPARCAVAYFPASLAHIQRLLQGPLLGKPYVLLGSGHNVILARDTYETPFVIFHGNMNWMRTEGTTLHAGAGAFTSDVCEYAASHALSGCEIFYDIPSSIGGAIFMNAGAYDEDIASLLRTATFWNRRTGRAETRTPDQLQFAYRKSVFQDDPYKIILSASFTLRKAPRQKIREKMDTIKAKRWASQPRAYPNAGSVFKRPQGRYVGPMLDALNLKGHSVAGFRVSPKHSGFIEKNAHGTGADLLALIAEIRQKVKAKYHLELELEQRIIDAP